ncbi:MAG TPA: hypothetical protein DDY32_06030 [Desulfobulbaceae bacterium]|nr:hypothetical protein [Desulfobulbaceae bacterium]
MLIDMSNYRVLLETAKEVIKETIPCEVVDNIISGNPDAMYSDTLEYFFEACDNSWFFIEREDLLEKFDTAFCTRFDFIKGFHACKITDESSYRDHGLRGKDESLILGLALERFSEHISPEKIRAACLEEKIPSWERGVYFFTAFKGALTPGQNHYLICGSETLQGIAGGLGLGYRGLLARQGRSCIIECDIPIRQVQYLYRDCFWRDFVTCAFQEMSGKAIDKKIKEMVEDWGFSTYGSIPPGQIKGFHYLKVSKHHLRSPLH